jgi:NAD(P)-dependent dehydrogenase (short-subunit alcohol dehydrogenase family)
MTNQHEHWTATGVGDQRARTAIVTGANTGIGFETAKQLAALGATVVLACRDIDRANEAMARIATTVPGARVSILPLDLGSLSSVREAAEQFRAHHDALDLLINNAGLMMPPYGKTADGFELQFGVNHLGHFAFTRLLLDLMMPVAGSRVVTVSSNAHRRGVVNFDDPQSQRRYRPVSAYAQSKLANLLFTYELQRRLATAEAATIAVAAHPGGSRTDLMRHSPPHVRFVVSRHTRPLFSWLVQDASMGALPIIRATLDPQVQGGEYYGPDGWNGFTGHPVRVESAARSHDRQTQRLLWELSERLTGVTYPFIQEAA